MRQHAEHLRLSFEKEMANEREAYLAQIAGLEKQLSEFYSKKEQLKSDKDTLL